MEAAYLERTEWEVDWWFFVTRQVPSGVTKHGLLEAMDHKIGDVPN